MVAAAPRLDLDDVVAVLDLVGIFALLLVVGFFGVSSSSSSSSSSSEPSSSSVSGVSGAEKRGKDEVDVVREEAVSVSKSGCCCRSAPGSMDRLVPASMADRPGSSCVLFITR